MTTNLPDNAAASEVDRGIHREGDLSRYTTDERDRLRALMNIGDASDADLDMLATVADRTGLDPFLREIYLIGRKTKTGGYRGEPERWETRWTVQTAIDGFRRVIHRYADSLGEPSTIGAPVWLDEDGNDHRVWLKKWGNPAAAIVEVRVGERLGVGIATWDEFVQTTKNGQPNSMWAKLGPTMLGKCAEAQASRKVCSLTAGLYVDEEMMQADQPVRMTATRVASKKRGASGLAAALSEPAHQPAAEPVKPAAIAAAPNVEETGDEVGDDLKDAVTEALAGFTTRPQVEAYIKRMTADDAGLAEVEHEYVTDAGRSRWMELTDEYLAADMPAGRRERVIMAAHERTADVIEAKAGAK